MRTCGYLVYLIFLVSLFFIQIQAAETVFSFSPVGTMTNSRSPGFRGSVDLAQKFQKQEITGSLIQGVNSIVSKDWYQVNARIEATWIEQYVDQIDLEFNRISFESSSGFTEGTKDDFYFGIGVSSRYQFDNPFALTGSAKASQKPVFGVTASREGFIDSSLFLNVKLTLDSTIWRNRKNTLNLAYGVEKSLFVILNNPEAEDLLYHGPKLEYFRRWKAGREFSLKLEHDFGSIETKQVDAAILESKISLGIRWVL